MTHIPHEPGTQCDFCLSEECDLVLTSELHEEEGNRAFGWISKDEKSVMWMVCAPCAVGAWYVGHGNTYTEDIQEEAIDRMLDKMVRAWTTYGEPQADNLRNATDKTLRYLAKYPPTISEFVASQGDDRVDHLKEISPEEWERRLDQLSERLMAQERG